jgi:molybdate transport repressor ModE-like protein
LKTPDWDDFRLFSAVVRAGSFTRAARDLKLSEPTISRRIKRLEELLGARLFDRGQGSPRLTREGRRVLDHANSAERSLGRAMTASQDTARGIDGDCSLVMGEGLGAYWMPNFVTAFLDRHPAIDIRLFTTPALAQDQTAIYDIQVQYLQPLEADHVAIRVATLHFMLYAAESYLVRFGMPARVEDLRNHRIADSAGALAARGSLMTWTSISKDPVFLTNSNVLLADVTRAGGVMGLLPTFTSALDAAIVPVLPDLHYSTPVFLCFERAAGEKPAARAVIDYLKHHVFDPKHMPWFAERFAPPAKNWPGLLGGAIRRAGAGT